VIKYDVPPDDTDFDNDVHLFDYGFIDSFGAVELITYVEDTFGVRVSPSDLIAYSLNTINEISQFIDLRKKGEL
jgi:D-alanine--poly(phosphoribitol) ligase subunit 2